MRLHRLRLRRATARLGASTALLAALIAAAALTAWASPPPAAGPGKPDLPLTGEWQFRQVGQEAWHKAEVPGTVHQDLMASGLIPDPFYRDNELKVQWVENADWEYRRMFDLPADIAARKHLELVCGGLDTFASLYLNGREIGRTDNMFRTWRFDAKPFLEPGANEIRVVFASPVRREKEMADKLPYSIPGNAPHARKAPYSFGWDWGPRLATSGIWRSIGLESWDEARLTDLDIQQDLSRKDEVTLKVAVVVESDREGRAELKVSVEPGSTVSLPLTLTSGLSRQRAEIKVGNPRLWWPNGLGEQNLYRVRAELHRGSSLLDSASRRIGLRTLELVQDKDAWGTSFYFRVNGVPFFAKGGNWIPADSFLPRVTRARYESLLRDCRAANMNMLRVWGGGAYESEDFYDLCDELGLVVWQDFMFACQMVPGDAAFRENVRVEAEQVVKALRHHPSLGLWCGNNECEEGWFFWGWKQTLPAKLWEDYQAIFEGILPRAVQAQLTPYLEQDGRPALGGVRRHALLGGLARPGAVRGVPEA
jgi:beta-mannosidase